MVLSLTSWMRGPFSKHIWISQILFQLNPHPNPIKSHKVCWINHHLVMFHWINLLVGAIFVLISFFPPFFSFFSLLLSCWLSTKYEIKFPYIMQELLKYLYFSFLNSLHLHLSFFFFFYFFWIFLVFVSITLHSSKPVSLSFYSLNFKNDTIFSPFFLLMLLSTFLF